MSTTQPTDALERLHEDERTFRTGLSVDLCRDNLDWLATNDATVDHIVRIERLRRENPRIWIELASACQDQTRRGVIAALVHNDGDAPYDALMEYTSCTRRTIQNHVYALRDAAVLDVVDGRPATVTFASDAVELLATDTLSLFYSE